MTDNIARGFETVEGVGFPAGTGKRGDDLRLAASETARPRNGLGLELASLGQFDLDPQFDLGQHRIEARIA